MLVKTPSNEGEGTIACMHLKLIKSNLVSINVTLKTESLLIGINKNILQTTNVVNSHDEVICSE